MPASASSCRDIARQLVETAPGNKINVIMGGGRQCLVSHANGTEADPIDTWSCARKDGRDLIQHWKQLRTTRKESFSVVSSTEELNSVDPSQQFVMGG